MTRWIDIRRPPAPTTTWKSNERDPNADDRWSHDEEPQSISTHTTDGTTNKEMELRSTLAAMATNPMDVAEIYSPERAITTARECGLRAGWAMDLTITDEN